uniref:Uncharacterized protein n=1 Tax=Serratia phage Spe5P4 TaxID=3159438 RepID=A0AAU7VI37_9CAUD
MTGKFTMDGQTVKNMVHAHVTQLKERAQDALANSKFSTAARIADEAATAEAFGKTIMLGRKYSFEEHVSVVEAPFVPGEL